MTVYYFIAVFYHDMSTNRHLKTRFQSFQYLLFLLCNYHKERVKNGIISNVIGKEVVIKPLLK